MCTGKLYPPLHDETATEQREEKNGKRVQKENKRRKWHQDVHRIVKKGKETVCIPAAEAASPAKPLYRNMRACSFYGQIEHEPNTKPDNGRVRGLHILSAFQFFCAPWHWCTGTTFVICTPYFMARTLAPSLVQSGEGGLKIFPHIPAGVGPCTERRDTFFRAHCTVRSEAFGSSWQGVRR